MAVPVLVQRADRPGQEVLTKMSTKKFCNIFFNFERLKQPCHYQKIVEF